MALIILIHALLTTGFDSSYTANSIVIFNVNDNIVNLKQQQNRIADVPTLLVDTAIMHNRRLEAKISGNYITIIIEQFVFVESIRSRTDQHSMSPLVLYMVRFALS